MVLLSLVPIILYLVVLRSFDAFSMVRPSTMAYWIVWGAVSALLMLATVSVAHATGHGWTASWVSPVLEELLKALPLLYLVWRRKVVFSAETQLFGEAIGGGFTLVENIIYINHFPSMSIATALVRGLGTGLMHMGCTALVATLVLLVVDRSKKLTPLSTILTPLTLLPSIGIHLFHNTTDVSPMTFMIGMIVVFFLAFYVVSLWGERSVVRWLDVSIESDVLLIAALREGRLTETHAGEYLMQLRNRFEPLVFFDMCVYVQLYLELLIEAKARVMLCDAGLQQKETDEQKSTRQSRLSELDALSRRIPRLGMQLLRPIIHATDKDRWVMRR